MGQDVAEELQRESQHYRGHGYTQHGVDERVYGHLAQQATPDRLFLGRGLVGGAQVVEPSGPSAWQYLRDAIIGWYGSTYHVGSDERCDNAHGHDYWIDEIADDFKRQSERGDDEGKLANLRHGKTATHGRFQWLTRQHVAESSQYALANHDGNHENDDWQRVCYKDMRVNEHAHRYEENRAKEVFHGSYDPFDTLHLYRLGKYAAHDKRAKGRGETYGRAYPCHGATKAKGHDDKGLVGHQLAGDAKQRGDDIKANEKPEYEEKAYFQQRTYHLRPVRVAARGYCRQHDHHHNGEDVFKNQDAHDELGERLLGKPHVVVCLVDDGGGRHGEHATKENAVHLAPTKEVSHAHAGHGHEKHRAHGRYDGSQAHFQDLFE